jgi:hypothetical protein
MRTCSSYLWMLLKHDLLKLMVGGIFDLNSLFPQSIFFSQHLYVNEDLLSRMHMRMHTYMCMCVYVDDIQVSRIVGKCACILSYIGQSNLPFHHLGSLTQVFKPHLLRTSLGRFWRSVSGPVAAAKTVNITAGWLVSAKMLCGTVDIRKRENASLTLYNKRVQP